MKVAGVRVEEEEEGSALSSLGHVESDPHSSKGRREATLSDNTYPSIVCLWLYLKKVSMTFSIDIFPIASTCTRMRPTRTCTCVAKMRAAANEKSSVAGKM